jgi:hypothetical protein
MTPKSIVAHIEGMRSREDLDAIIKAAESRDKRLANLEADERWRRVWAKYSHLKPGITVFLHSKPQGKNAFLYEQPLKVRQMKPRSKEIVVQALLAGTKVTHTAMMCDAYKLSEEPTVVAFDNALVGEISSRKGRQ